MCLLLEIVLHTAQTSDLQELTVGNALLEVEGMWWAAMEIAVGTHWLVVCRGGYSFLWDAEVYVQEREISVRGDGMSKL